MSTIKLILNFQECPLLYIALLYGTLAVCPRPRLSGIITASILNCITMTTRPLCWQILLRAKRAKKGEDLAEVKVMELRMLEIGLNDSFGGGFDFLLLFFFCRDWKKLIHFVVVECMFCILSIFGDLYLVLFDTVLSKLFVKLIS